MKCFIDARRAGKATPLVAYTTATLRGRNHGLGKAALAWTKASGFNASPGSFCLVPDARGALREVLVGVVDGDDPFALAGLPLVLPEGVYALDKQRGLLLDPARVALGWGLGAYRFDRYRKAARQPARLALPAALAAANVIEAVHLTRDLVNTPTEDMGPAELRAAIDVEAQRYGASVREWVGEELLEANFPTIHAVGRASHRAPRLVELTWGKARHPRLTIVGKGVCFDTGGLDIKTGDFMRNMKKDMGGAAHAIALASLVMGANLPVRLQLLVPAVENAIAGNAYRPGEVIRTRAGITVEVDNTDAEGRLVLCDALSYAVESPPDLLIDIATLTGAARVALGADIAALFANNDSVANTLLEAARSERDPMWRMPLWRPYRSLLDSSIADCANAGPSRHAGAITAALYLERFVPESVAWLHLDIYAWNDADRPGRPRGGEAQGLRALFAFLEARYRGA